MNSELLGDKAVVLPGYRDMFAREGVTAITHGGIHIEELIVPFVEIEQ